MSGESEVREAMRGIRAAARADPEPRPELSPHPLPETSPPLTPVSVNEDAEPQPTVSPATARLNALWDVRRLREAQSKSAGGIRGRLRRAGLAVVHRLFGGPDDLQEQFNSASVQFDNEIVAYVDERFDRMARHYDAVLGAHGKRMEEIDERHLVLQRELIRHVHDLVERIEFVFESAEQQHLYLEGRLREIREELERLQALADTRAAATLRSDEDP